MNNTKQIKVDILLLTWVRLFKKKNIKIGNAIKYCYNRYYQF